MWFTLHWPPVSHREKLAPLVLMGCRAEKDGGGENVIEELLVGGFEEKGACMCVCAHALVKDIMTDYFQTCILTVLLQGREKERPGIGHTMEPFVSHLSLLSWDLCVFVCVCAHYTYFTLVFWQQAQHCLRVLL